MSMIGLMLRKYCGNARKNGLSYKIHELPARIIISDLKGKNVPSILLIG